jgi:hypothetical protein
VSTRTTECRAAVQDIRDSLLVGLRWDSPHEYVNRVERAFAVLGDMVTYLTTQLDATALARVERPGGGVYRAREIPRAEWSQGRIIVRRSHDLAQAGILARELFPMDDDALSSTPTELVWLDKNNRPDPVRGAPAVVFHITHPEGGPQ